MKQLTIILLLTLCVKIIVAQEDPKQKVKDFIDKLNKIEAPASKAFNECETTIKTINLYNPNTAQIVSNCLTTSKKKCDNAMFVFLDLKVPTGLPKETIIRLRNTKENLSQAYSSKAMAHGFLKSYLKSKNQYDLENYEEELKRAEQLILKAVSDIAVVMTELGILTKEQEKAKKREDERIKKEKEKLEQATKLIEEGDELVKKRQFEAGIDKYNQALSTDISGTLTKECNTKLAQAHYKLAEQQSIEKKYKLSSINYRKAISIDKNIKTDVSIAFESMRKKIMPTTIVSTIPGLGQLINRKFLKGAVLLSIGGASTYLSYSFNQKGNSKYEVYKNSTNVNELTGLYDEAESFRKKSIAFGSIAVSTALFSIIDNYIFIKRFNNIWDTDKLITIRPVFYEDYTCMSLLIKF